MQTNLAGTIPTINILNVYLHQKDTHLSVGVFFYLNGDMLMEF